MRFIALVLAFVWLMVALLFLLLAIALAASGVIFLAPFPLLFAWMAWKTCRISWRQARELPR